MRRSALALLVAAAAAAALSAGGLPASAARAPSGHWLVLASDRDGTWRPYSVRPDGSRLTPLLPAGRAALWPMSVSGDGRTIAYHQLGRTHYVSRASGAGLRRVARAATGVGKLSPDGKLLAYGLASSSLWVVGRDGRGRRRLASASRMYFSDLDWSPDGRAIAVSTSSLRSAARSVMVQPLRGMRRVVASGRDILHGPAWSPDGRWIAYSRYRFGPRPTNGLHLVAADGSDARRVFGGWVGSFAWSPDGGTLAVSTSRVRPSGEIVLLRPDGRMLRRLRPRGLPAAPHNLAWSPDGRLLAFEEQREYEIDVWVVGADGRGLRRVTASGTSRLAGWSTLAPARRPAPPLLPSEWVLGAGTIATRRPVTALSADGTRAAFVAGWTGADCPHAAVWTPSARRLDRFGRPARCPQETGVFDVTLAGTRAAWRSVAGCGNYCEVRLETATLGGPARLVTEGAFPSGERPDYHLRGDGDLLVFNFGDAARLVRIGAGSERCGSSPVATTAAICTTLRTGTHARPVDSVSGRLIAIRGREAVAVLDAAGALVRLFPVAAGAARLDGGRLVVARSNLLESYDVGTGAAVGLRPLPGGYRLHDVDGGVAVLTRAESAIMLLRLDDGRSFTLAPGRPPRLADLEPAGLFYSYATAGGEGRVVLMPRAEVVRLLDAASG